MQGDNEILQQLNEPQTPHLNDGVKITKEKTTQITFISGGPLKLEENSKCKSCERSKNGGHRKCSI